LSEAAEIVLEGNPAPYIDRKGEHRQKNADPLFFPKYGTVFLLSSMFHTWLIRLVVEKT